MTDSSDARSSASAAETTTRAGLRVRLWVGCMGAALTSAAGLVWGLASGFLGSQAGETNVLLLGAGAVVVASLAVGVMLASWLDHGIVGRLRGLLRGAAAGQIPTHDGSPAGADWGELLELTHRLQSLLSRQRQLAETAEDLQELQRQVTMTRTAIERWTHQERWQALPETEGTLRPVIETLNLGFARQAQVHEQNRDAANQIHEDLAASVEDARETSGQAERSFVDATAMLTTVRELQRLADELSRSLEAAAQSAIGDQAQAYEEWRTTAVGAIEELVAAAGESVQSLADGLMRVEEIASQVNLLANRATLISLNVVVGAARAEPSEGGTGIAEELKKLVHEVQAATQRVDQLSNAVSDDVRNAGERMRGVRERVALRLDQEPAPAAGDPAKTVAQSRQLLERVREMVQDAAQKSERLSATGERVSRAAARLARELEDEVRDLEGLVVRLSPPTAESSAPPGEAHEDEAHSGPIAFQAPPSVRVEPRQREERS